MEILKNEDKCLSFTLTKKWFNLFKSGEKKAEYRAYNSFWCARIRDLYRFGCMELTLGYPRKDDFSRRLVFVGQPFVFIYSPSCVVPPGLWKFLNPSWGFDSSKTCFVIIPRCYIGDLLF